MAVTEIFDKSGMQIIRINCSCLVPEHSIDIMVDDDMDPSNRFYVSVQLEHEPHLWYRIKNAFKVLLGQRLCSGEAVLSDEDMRKVAKFIMYNTTVNRPPIP